MGDQRVKPSLRWCDTFGTGKKKSLNWHHSSSLWWQKDIIASFLQSVLYLYLQKGNKKISNYLLVAAPVLPQVAPTRLKTNIGLNKWQLHLYNLCRIYDNLFEYRQNIWQLILLTEGRNRMEEIKRTRSFLNDCPIIEIV